MPNNKANQTASIVLAVEDQVDILPSVGPWGNPLFHCLKVKTDFFYCGPSKNVLWLSTNLLLCMVSCGG